MNSTTEQQVLIAQLLQLGFTQLESEVYLFLLINGPHTGYAVAKGISKAVANVYKSIESLANKGALEVSVGDSKMCHAIAWQQVLAEAKNRFDDNITQLTAQFKQLPDRLDDESVYQLKNSKQVLSSAQEIIETAQSILLAELEPVAANYFAPMLVAAASRGVEVRVKVYGEIAMPGVILTVREQGEQVYAKTKDVSFKMCADGKAALTASLTSDFNQVVQAFKTKSALVCMDFYCGILYEQILTDLKRLIPQQDFIGCQKLLDETAHLHPFSTQNSVFTAYQSRYQLQK